MHTRRTAAPRSLEPERLTAIGRPATATPGSAPTSPGESADALTRELQQRVKAPTMPAGAAERFRMDAAKPAQANRQGPEPVFRSPQEAATLASGPDERAVRIRSGEARQRARHLVKLSKGRPMDSDVAASLRGRFGGMVDDVTVHEDERAGLAAQLLGAHAFSLGHRVFLGATLNTPDGPSRLDALRHEVVHIAQGETGARTGRFASRQALEGQARDGSPGHDLERDLLGADPDSIQEWLWVPALIAAGYILLDPDPANAPTSRHTRTYPRKPMGQRVGEAVALAAPMGLLGKTPTLIRAATAGATSQVGYTAAGDIGQGRYSGTDVYAGRAATGAVLWMVPVPAARQYAAGAVGPRLWGAFAASGATGGVTLRAMGDIGQGRISPIEDYLLWGGTGMGVGLLGAGGVRGLDYLSTRGAVASDILVSEMIAGQVPADAAAVEAALGAAPWWGRASQGYLASRNMVIVYRGQGAVGEQILSPLARGPGGIGASEEVLAQLRAAGLTEQEIAGLTAKYGPEVLPGSYLPPELQGLVGQPVGGAGIPVTRLPGVASDYATASGVELAAGGVGANSTILVIRAPAGAPVSALETGWGAKSLVEQEYIIFHQIPGGYIVNRVSPGGITPLRAGFEGSKDVLELVAPGTPRVQ